VQVSRSSGILIVESRGKAASEKPQQFTHTRTARVSLKYFRGKCLFYQKIEKDFIIFILRKSCDRKKAQIY